MGTLNVTTAVLDDATGQQYDNNPRTLKVCWDDVQGSVGNSDSPSSAPNGALHTYLAGVEQQYGVSYALNELSYHTLQLAHATQLNCEYHPHIHFTLLTHTAAHDGQYFKFSMDIIKADVGGLWTEVGTVTGEQLLPSFVAATEDWTLQSNLLEFTAVSDLGNTGVSTLLKFRLKRIAATSGTEFTGDVIVDFVDGHVQIDQDGSRQEYVK